MPMSWPSIFILGQEGGTIRGNGWGFEVYCTFPQYYTLSSTSDDIQTESGSPTPDSKAEKAIARIKQWMERGLYEDEKSPERERLQQCCCWTVHYMPGASIEDVRTAHKEFLAAENFPGNDDEDSKTTERVCLMVDEDIADAILASALPGNDEELYAVETFVAVVDPDYEGEPQVLAQRGRGPPPPYPAAGVDWYTGMIKCVPVALWGLYGQIANQGWSYQHAARFGRTSLSEYWYE